MTFAAFISSKDEGRYAMAQAAWDPPHTVWCMDKFRPYWKFRLPQADKKIFLNSLALFCRGAKENIMTFRNLLG